MARLTISVISIVLSAIAYYVFNILPFGFFYGNTPANLRQWESQSLWFNFGLFKRNGGWVKADWEAKWYDAATYLALLFVIAISRSARPISFAM